MFVLIVYVVHYISMTSMKLYAIGLSTFLNGFCFKSKSFFYIEPKHGQSPHFGQSKYCYCIFIHHNTELFNEGMSYRDCYNFISIFDLSQ